MKNRSNNTPQTPMIYPNPSTNGSFLIQLPSSKKNFNLTICDVKGNTVYSDNISFSQSQENLYHSRKNLNPGVYFVKVNGLLFNWAGTLSVK